MNGIGLMPVLSPFIGGESYRPMPPTSRLSCEIISAVLYWATTDGGDMGAG